MPPGYEGIRHFCQIRAALYAPAGGQALPGLGGDDFQLAFVRAALFQHIVGLPDAGAVQGVQDRCHAIEEIPGSALPGCLLQDLQGDDLHGLLHVIGISDEEYGIIVAGRLQVIAVGQPPAGSLSDHALPGKAAYGTLRGRRVHILPVRRDAGTVHQQICHMIRVIRQAFYGIRASIDIGLGTFHTEGAEAFPVGTAVQHHHVRTCKDGGVSLRQPFRQDYLIRTV